MNEKYATFISGGGALTETDNNYGNWEEQMQNIPPLSWRRSYSNWEELRGTDAKYATILEE